MEVLKLIVIQCVAMLGFIELFVWFMPTALKRASEQNCYRVDGTRSDPRAYRERRGRNRLRRDMLAVLLLVFLTGNALYFTLDHDNSLKKLFTTVWNGAFDSPASANVVIHHELSLKSDSGEPLNWRFLLIVIGSWALVCFLFVGWGAIRAYQSYAEGVKARGAEHFHLDLSRMSITDTEMFKEAVRKTDASQGVA